MVGVRKLNVSYKYQVLVFFALAALPLTVYVVWIVCSFTKRSLKFFHLLWLVPGVTPTKIVLMKSLNNVLRNPFAVNTIR